MLGAIIGDIGGSIYEFDNIKTEDFELMPDNSFFTDDTVMTVATADCILNKGDFATYYKNYYKKYPGRGYGAMFNQWGISESLEPYNSYGNGSAMRVSPVGFAYSDMQTVLDVAKKSAECTHNHPEGIRGAQAIAACIFTARQKKDKDSIKKTAEDLGYDLSFNLDEIKANYSFDETCQGSVPQAIKAFLESDSFEDAIKKAIALGGDSDTVACMVGGISEAYYGVPGSLKKQARDKLDSHLKGIIEEFYKRYAC
ncbi:MAG: ADP-ribosylglycohydrolase family protein [Actinobacteria bacterium]|nr:ADP-ribosylglycohydrolase family protein [Actinomycetota bacterium]